VHLSKSKAVCRCEVFAVADDGSEKLCALAQGTIARLGDAPPSRA
jgi:acyl-coenzyme A thioesterase PaaI-like protein